MSAMEKSLRRALEAGDASNPAFRDTIYTASERALERMLANATDPDAAHAQRVRLAETINRIEEDYYVAEAEDEAWEAAPDPDAEHAADAGFVPPEGEHEAPPPERDDDAVPESASDEVTELGRHEPETEISASSPAAALTPSEPASDTETWSPGGARRSAGGKSTKRSVRPFLLALVILLAVLFAGIYFLKTTVLGGADAGTQTSDGTSGDGSVETASWINLFDGTQLELISTPAGGNVSAVTGSGDRPAVRLASASEGGEVGVVIGPGVINTIKGHKVRVEITAGSSDGANREFSVRCLFGAETACDRQRFTTLQDSQSFVFDMTVPANPSASGSIAIDPSLGATQKNLDLYGVRLRDLGKA